MDPLEQTSKLYINVNDIDLIKQYAKENNIVGEISHGLGENGEVTYNLGNNKVIFNTVNGKRVISLVPIEVEEVTNEDTPIVIENETENGLSDFTNCVIKLYNGEELSSSEMDAIGSYVTQNLNKMQNGTIDFDNQNALDCYIEYLRNNKSNDSIISKYDGIVFERTKGKLTEIRRVPKPKVLVLGKNDKKGTILTITVLEVTALLGILLGVIALALK